MAWPVNQVGYGGRMGPTGATGPMGPEGPEGPEGAAGANGADGDDAYVYIAYASDDAGTDFTLVFNAALDYIAIKNTTVEIPAPVVGDFAGLWKNYKGATGMSAALFEVDINGDLEPITDNLTDEYYELDGNDDIMPKAA